MSLANAWLPLHGARPPSPAPGPAQRVVVEVYAVSADPLAATARAARDGDVAAQRRLCEAIAPSMLAPVRMVMGAAHPELEDVLQEALVGVLRGLASFRWESSVLHFARRVATKRAIESRRRARTAARTMEGAAQIDPPAATTPRESFVAERRRRHLRALLDELPDAQSQALGMRAVLGFSVEEIADSTGAPVNTVRSRLRLAKEALRERIAGDPAMAELAEVGDD
jgi:RNA polymerase sigma-70 factor (ECF subfamily)